MRKRTEMGELKEFGYPASHLFFGHFLGCKPQAVDDIFFDGKPREEGSWGTGKISFRSCPLFSAQIFFTVGIGPCQLCPDLKLLIRVTLTK
jgi:hypothetical protein